MGVGCWALVLFCLCSPSAERLAPFPGSMPPRVLNSEEEQLHGPRHARPVEQQDSGEADQQYGREERLKETERRHHDRDDILREGQEELRHAARGGR